MLMSTTPILVLLVSNLFIGMLSMWFYYRGAMSDAEKKAEKLKTSLKNKDEKAKELKEGVLEHETTIEGLQKSMVTKDKNIRRISAQVKERDKSIKELNQDLADVNAKRDSLNVQLDRREESISLLREQLKEKEDSIGQLEDDLDALEENRQELNTRAEKAEAGVLERQREIEERDTSIELMKEKLASLEKKSAGFLARAEAAEAGMVKLEAEIEERAREAASQKTRIRHMQDDLTKIDGIGPRVSAVLRSAGITSFSKLAEREPEEILEHLQVGKVRVPGTTDPSSWREQAKRAGEGDWEGLKAMQASIKEGRRERDLQRREAQDAASDATIIVHQ